MSTIGLLLKGQIAKQLRPISVILDTKNFAILIPLKATLVGYSDLSLSTL